MAEEEGGGEKKEKKLLVKKQMAVVEGKERIHERREPQGVPVSVRGSDGELK